MIAMSRSEKIDHIRRLPLFSELRREEIEQIEPLFMIQTYQGGEYVYRQAERSYALYLFVTGRGRLLRVDADGIERRGDDVEPGEYVGERSLFLHEERSHSLVIVREAVVLILPKREMDGYLREHPEIKARLNVRLDVRNLAQDQDFPWLESGEMVLRYTRRHIWAFWRRAALSIPLLLLTAPLPLIALLLPLPDAVSNLLFVLSLLPMILFPAATIAYNYYDWRNDWFVVTNQRVVHEERVLLTFNETRQQAPLSSIQAVKTSQQGYFAEQFGFGDLLISTIRRGGHDQLRLHPPPGRPGGRHQRRAAPDQRPSRRREPGEDSERDRPLYRHRGPQPQPGGRSAPGGRPPGARPDSALDPDPPGRALAQDRDLFRHPGAGGRGLPDSVPHPLADPVERHPAPDPGDDRAGGAAGDQPDLPRGLALVVLSPPDPDHLLPDGLPGGGGVVVVHVRGLAQRPVHHRGRNPQAHPPPPALVQDEQSTVLLRNVQGVNVSVKGIWQKLLNYGSVVVQTAADDGGQATGEIAFQYIYQPHALQEDILSRQRAASRRPRSSRSTRWRSRSRAGWPSTTRPPTGRLRPGLDRRRQGRLAHRRRRNPLLLSNY
jgi:hypothetical protein